MARKQRTMVQRPAPEAHLKMKIVLVSSAASSSCALLLAFFAVCVMMRLPSSLALTQRKVTLCMAQALLTLLWETGFVP